MAGSAFVVAKEAVIMETTFLEVFSGIKMLEFR